MLHRISYIKYIVKILLKYRLNILCDIYHKYKSIFLINTFYLDYIYVSLSIFLAFTVNIS